MENNKTGKVGVAIRILLAEDNEYNYLLFKAFLKEYTFVRVTNGVEAVKEMKENDFDLILMDIKMPEMDGLEATRKIREFDNNIPIIAVTANTFSEDRLNALKAGCNEFIIKPFTKKELINVINNNVHVKI